jgi:hypothetical protein
LGVGVDYVVCGLGFRLDGPRFGSRCEKEIFIFSKMSRPTLGSTQHLVEWIPAVVFVWSKEAWDFLTQLHLVRGPGSSVGIATGYVLEGPGIKSRCGRDFSHLFRPALGPNQPSVKWVPSLSRR